MPCEHRHLFGKEREGIHATRLFGMAAFDLLGTIAMAALLSFFVGGGRSFAARFALSTAGLLCLAVACHRLFCVDTALNIFLFGKTL